MFSQIRTYFKSRIAEFNSDYEEHQNGFDLESVGNTELDFVYHIDLTTATVTDLDQTLQNDMAVTLTLWKRGGSDDEVLDAKDQLLDDAHCINLHIVDPREYNNTNNIRDIESETIGVTQLDETNDNVIQVQLTYSVSLFYNKLDYK